jgi:tetrahydrodipicolinate N-succinyltransferase
MINTNRCQEHLGLYRICSVQQKVHQELLEKIDITNKSNKEEHTLKMKIQRRSSISEIERRVLKEINTQDVRFQKIRTNENRRIRFSHRCML